MYTFSDLAFWLAGSSVIKPYLFICTDAGEYSSIGREGRTKDESLVLCSQTRVELEWGAMVKDQAGVIRARNGTKRTLLAYRDRVDL
jgi:hypothetical protein